MRDISSKRSVILLSLIAGVLALIASGRAWINGTLNDGVLSTNAVDVTGNQAIPGYFGIALVACAGGHTPAGAMAVGGADTLVRIQRLGRGGNDPHIAATAYVAAAMLLAVPTIAVALPWLTEFNRLLRG